MADTRRLNELARSAGPVFPDGDLVVALSGGADSAAVAFLAKRQSGRHGRAVRSIHVNHGLPASGIMERAALAVAGRLGIDLEVLRVELDRPSEGEAREKRYSALLSAMAPGEWLATGHTADDQAETVLMNLLRGAGVTGLSGIRQVDPPVVRPILAMWRSEARELAILAGLPFADDPTNEDLRHLRNRIRLRLLPAIESEFNPAFRQVLVRNAGVLLADMAALERLAGGVRVEVRPGAVRMVAGEVAAADPAAANIAVRRGLAALRSPHPPASDEVERVLAVGTGRSERADLVGGVTATRSGPWLVLELGAVEPPVVSGEIEVPGITRLGRFRFEVSTTATRPPVPLSQWGFVAEEGARLMVRPASEGGVIAGKEVSRALAEAGVPESRRPGWPVVHRGGEAVWIPGVRRSGWPGGDAERYLCAFATEDAGWERSEP